jgi:hypothetical protein
LRPNSTWRGSESGVRMGMNILKWRKTLQPAKSEARFVHSPLGR